MAMCSPSTTCREYINNFVDFALESTGVPQLTAPQISKYYVALPPTKAEQEAIAEALSDADALIESLEQLIAKKRYLKQGTMQELLTGKKRLPGFEIKSGYKQTETGAIPVDWEVRALGEIGIFKNGINKDRTAFGHGSPFVNLLDVFGAASISSIDHLGLIASTSFEQNTYDLRRGDVIFIRSSVKPSGVGLTVVVDNYLAGTIYSGFLIRFRDGGFIDAKFKKHCFYEEGFRQRIIGASSVSANTNINQDSLKRVPIILPPMKAEQKAIAEILSDMDADIAALETKLTKARQLKQGMMQELLIGRIRLV
jgi:type I restriction enzyme, S subunit